MQISPRGAAVGALVGAAARAAVVGLHLGQNVLLVFVIPSAAIGLLVGAVAGGLGRPVRGMIAGFLLSAVVFELFLLPCVSLCGILITPAHGLVVFSESLRYALEMGVAGAFAGLAGGFAAGRRKEMKAEATESAES